MSLLDTASLIVTPNGYKEGKLYSVIPSDGSGDMSVTRATTATRVNSQGLVELVPYNLAQYSQTFTNGVWGVAGYGNAATIVANDTTAPDGTMTASKATFTAAGTQGRLVQSISTTNGQAYNASFYVKQGNKTTINLYSDAAVFGTFITFNFNTGTITNSNNVYGNDVDNIGNGWYRISFWSYAPSSTAQFGFITFGGEDGFCYIWGGQFEQNTTATTYQKTETRLNIPRLDYSNGTCPSILVEPQRTNRTLYSSSFDNGSWDKAFVSVTANQIASPSGVQDADKLVENSVNEIHALYNLQPYTSTTTATASVFFKKGTRKFFSIKLQIGGNSYTQVYDSENVTTTSNSSNGLTNVSSSIIDFGNGWVRAILTGTNPSGAADAYTIYGLSNSGTPTFNPSNFNPTYQGTGTDYGYIWGAQLEAGSYATSYIPTTSASVTRNTDVISKTGISSLIGQTEGVVFWEGYLPQIVDVGGNNISNILNTEKSVDTKTAIAFQFISNLGKFRVAMFIGNGTFSPIFQIEQTGLTSGQYAKIAFAYKTGDSALYINGSLAGTSTTSFISSTQMAEITLNDNVVYYGYPASQEINASALWKTRLSNTQLAQLTTI